MKATFPPKGYYRGTLNGIKALREGRIGELAHILYTVIEALTWNGHGCDWTDAELAPFVHRHPRQVARYVGELQEAGLIRVELDPSGRRIIYRGNGDGTTKETK